MLLRERVAAVQAELAELMEELKRAEAGEDLTKRNQFRKFDAEKRLVYAEIYLPEIEDAHGHCMTAEEIEKMAHGFMLNKRNANIDLNHDNNTDYDCCMVETFIAQEGDPNYLPGAWVGVVKVGSDAIWQKIKDGEITGFSFEGMGYLVESDR